MAKGWKRRSAWVLKLVGGACVVATLMASSQCSNKFGSLTLSPLPGFEGFFGGMQYDPPAQDAPASPTVPYFAFLHRETNCSLTRIATDTQFNILSTYQNYQDYLHQVSGLSTKADTFAAGCTPATTGIASQTGAYLGVTAAGNSIAAITSTDGVTVYQVSAAGVIVGSPVDYSIIGSSGSSSGAAPIGIASADLNGDGILDMVVASSPFTAPNVGALTVFFGKGDGTFQTPVTISLTIPVTGVTLDDVNGDGHLDIVATAFLAPGAQGPGLAILLGDGKGNFAAPISGPASAGGTVAVTGDFNGDGKKDLATAAGQILLGHGDGTFTLQPNPVFNASAGSFGDAGGVAAGDFNHDGKIDLAFTNVFAGTVDIYNGRGDGTFSYGHSYPTVYAPSSITATDLDGDGNLDLFVGVASGGVFAADPSSDGIFQSLLGRGDGSFVAGNAYIPLGPQAEGSSYFDVGDFNGDHKPDLVTIDIDGTNGPYLALLTGVGDGTFAAQAPIALTNDFGSGSSVGAILAADVNADGDADVIFARVNQSQLAFISILIGNGHGGFATQVDYPVAGAVKSLVALDLNGDGKLDLAFTANPGTTPATGTLYLMLNAGDGTFTMPVAADQAPYLNLLAVGDVNGDGVSDLVVSAIGDVTNNIAGATYLYLGTGKGTLQPRQTLSGGANPGGVAIADLNNDGKPDIIISGTTSTTQGYLTTLVNQGGGTFAAPATVATLDPFPTSVAVADIEHNQKPDIVLSACCDLTYTYVLRGNGDGTFNTQNGVIPVLSTSQVELVDVNGDSRPDLVGVSNQLALEVFLNVGGSQPVSSATTTTLTGPTSVAAGSSVTFTATVVGAASIPTGSASLLDGSNAIATATLSATGVATFNIATLSAGSHTLTAQYGGDASNAPSTSAALVVAVGTPTFALSINPGALSIAPGQSGTATVTATPSFGFSAAISYSCSGLPVGATCSFGTPTTASNGVSSTLLTIGTAAGTTAQISGRRDGPTTVLAAPFIALPLIGYYLPRPRRHRRRRPTFFIILALTLLCAACGGDDSSAPGSGGTPVGGPTTVTIYGKASSGTQSTTLQLTIT